MRAYPRCRNSGVEWLGEVPDHWDVSRLTDLADLVNGFPFDSELFDPSDGIPLVRIRDLYTGSTEVRWSGDPVPEAEIGNGDVLIGMDGDFNVAWWTHGLAVLNQRLCCLRALAARASQRYLYYCLPFPLKTLNDVTYATTVKHLSSLDVLKFRLPLPPLDEQHAITAFLDRETERIDALVAKKRLLIERLEEYRSALITRTVTRGLPPEAARATGLDPSPRLKPSGVEWLGEVPDHWDVSRLTDLADLVNGFPFDSELFDPSDGIPLVRIRDLYTGSTEVRWSGDPVPEAEIGNGDVLIGMDGDFNVAWWTHGLAVLNQRLCCLRALAARASQRYLYYCLPFPLKTLNDVTYATTVKHLSSLDVLKFRLPLPPLDEQHQIVAFLDRETARIDGLTSEVEAATERLQEYRTALITAAVTGKIDVRE